MFDTHSQQEPLIFDQKTPPYNHCFFLGEKGNNTSLEFQMYQGAMKNTLKMASDLVWLIGSAPQSFFECVGWAARSQRRAPRNGKAVGSVVCAVGECATGAPCDRYNPFYFLSQTHHTLLQACRASFKASKSEKKCWNFLLLRWKNWGSVCLWFETCNWDFAMVNLCLLKMKKPKKKL